MIMINGKGVGILPSREDYTDRLWRLRDQTDNYVRKKYGEEYLPRYILFNKMQNNRDKNIKMRRFRQNTLQWAFLYCGY